VPPEVDRTERHELGGAGNVLIALTTDFLGPQWSEGRPCAEWSQGVEVLDRPRMSGARILARLLRSAGRYDAVVLDGSIGWRGGYVDQLVASLIGRRRARPLVVISDCTWKRGSWWLDRLACRLGMRLMDSPWIIYCVLSNDEAKIFPRTWGVDPGRVAFVPWPYTLADGDLSPAPSDDGGVFAGGDSLRDYATLIRAARDVPAAVTIATRLGRRRFDSLDVPPNVRMGPLPPHRFIEEMRRARVVVAPLQPTTDRSSGQTTYVNAMAMGKPVVVTDCLGVRDYIEDGDTGVVVPPADAEALGRALRWAVDPTTRGEVRRMGARAGEVARARFRPQDYVARLVEIAREALSHVP